MKLETEIFQKQMSAAGSSCPSGSRLFKGLAGPLSARSPGACAYLESRELAYLVMLQIDRR